MIGLRAGRAVFRLNGAASTSAVLVLGVGQLGVAVVLWATCAPRALPGPVEVLAALGTLWRDEGLGRELLTSLATSLEAIALMLPLGLGLAYASVLPALRPIAHAVSKGRFLGLTGLSFGFTLLLGGGRPLVVGLLAFGMLVFFVTTMVAEVAAIPAARFEHARSLGLSGWRIVREVVILGTVDRALDALRQNAAIGWTMVTMVECLARSGGGVGPLLVDQNRHFHLAEVFAVQLAILGLGLVQDWALARLRLALCPHVRMETQRRNGT